MNQKNLNLIAKNNKGAVFFLMVFVAVVMFIFLMASIEIFKVFTVKYNVETQLTRLANNAVESSIDDELRKDGYNLLSPGAAESFFEKYFDDYTQSSPEEGWDIARAGYEIYGSCFGGEDRNFLYLIEIKISDVDGVYDPSESLETQTEEPGMCCEGILYIANSIPGLVDDFVFKIPFTVKSKNFRINEMQLYSTDASGGE